MSLSKPASFIKSLHAHGIEPTVFCTHLIHTAASGDGSVSPEQTAGEFEIDTEGAVHLHDLASEFNLVAYPHPTANRVTVNRSTVTEFIQFLTYFNQHARPSEIELLADQGIHDVEFTTAVPAEFQNHSADLMARLIQLARNAESELLVVTPFFTRFGVDTFVDHLARATDRGVNVTLLTRDVAGGGDNSGHVSQIFETVVESGKETNLSILEYASDHGRLHAKTLITDRKKAYVGSANLTTYSLKNAIEIGLIVEGSVVEDIVEFFALVEASMDTSKITQDDLK